LKIIANSDDDDDQECFLNSVTEFVDQHNIDSNLQKLRDQLSQKSRTAKL
jgi:hypothetical protein